MSQPANPVVGPIVQTAALPKPVITRVTGNQNRLEFTVANIDTSVVNGIRRTLLTDLPFLAVDVRPPSDQPGASSQEPTYRVAANTTRIHNELLLHRISSVPVHTTDPLFHQKYQLEIDLSNESEDGVMYLTTEHFRLRPLTSADDEPRNEPRNEPRGDLLPLEQSRKVFPADPVTKQFIEIVKLRPAIGNVPGERVALTARFYWTKSGGEFAACNTAYKCTVDSEAADKAWTKHEGELLATHSAQDRAVLDRMAADAKLDFYRLDAYRYVVPGSFDFWVQTYCAHPNAALLAMAGTALRGRLTRIAADIESGVLPLVPSSQIQAHGYTDVIASTTPNSWDFVLEGETETTGNMLAYAVRQLFYETAAASSSELPSQEREVLLCVFKKFHPDSNHGILRVVTVDADTAPTGVRRIVRSACAELVKVIDVATRV